jgi:iron complex transport system substrate-binding protein
MTIGAQRIVSLLPSATEIVCALGLRPGLVGVSHECDYPADVGTLPRVTRTRIPSGLGSSDIDRLVRAELGEKQALYSLDMGLLHALEPDLLVTQALCDVCAVAADEVESAACALAGSPRVLNLEPMTLEEVFATHLLVGEAAGIAAHARAIVAALRRRVARVAQAVRPVAHRPRVAFLEWLDPPFNGGHWTPELIALAGGVDVFDGAGQRSRTLAWDEVLRTQPEVLVMALCGFDQQRAARDLPGLAARPGFLDMPCARSGQIWLVDGNQYFSRPGPRLVDSLELLGAILHPERVSLPADVTPAWRIDVARMGSATTERSTDRWATA